MLINCHIKNERIHKKKKRQRKKERKKGRKKIMVVDGHQARGLGVDGGTGNGFQRT